MFSNKTLRKILLLSIFPVIFLIIWGVITFQYLFIGSNYFYANIQDSIRGLNDLLPRSNKIYPRYEIIWLFPMSGLFIWWVLINLFSIVRSIYVIPLIPLLMLNFETLNSTLFRSFYIHLGIFGSYDLAPLLWIPTIILNIIFSILIVNLIISNKIKLN